MAWVAMMGALTIVNPARSEISTPAPTSSANAPIAGAGPADAEIRAIRDRIDVQHRSVSGTKWEYSNLGFALLGEA